MRPIEPSSADFSNGSWREQRLGSFWWVDFGFYVFADNPARDFLIVTVELQLPPETDSERAWVGTILRLAAKRQRSAKPSPPLCRVAANLAIPAPIRTLDSCFVLCNVRVFTRDDVVFVDRSVRPF